MVWILGPMLVDFAVCIVLMGWLIARFNASPQMRIPFKFPVTFAQQSANITSYYRALQDPSLRLERNVFRAVKVGVAVFGALMLLLLVANALLVIH